MNHIKMYYVVIALAVANILSGCQQPQKAAAPAQSQPASATAKPCGGQSSAPEPWLYNHHSEWELPGAAVPEIYAAAKTVLIEDWKMPSQTENRENQYVDFLSASIKVSSALNTTFDLSIVKLNEKSCRLAIDAKSKQVPSAQLEEHCSLMYDNIINYLNTSPQDKQRRKETWVNNQTYYAIQEYEFDYPVKNVFDAAIPLLEQMHVSKSGSGYDDFAGRIQFTTGNNNEMMFDIQMIDENKCLLAFFSRYRGGEITKKWSDIFVRRLRQKLTETPSVTTSPSAPEPRPVQNTYYGQGRSPSSVSKIVEYPYTVEKTETALRDTLRQLNITLPGNVQRDALTAKLSFTTANSADWWITISQIDPNRSKVLLSATKIYAEDFEKYTAAIIENFEKQLQRPGEPAVQSAEPAATPAPAASK